MIYSELSQEVRFLIMLLGEMTKVQKTSVIYEDNQGAIFLAKNRQVSISTKHIDILHYFLLNMVEEKGIDIKYIWIEDEPMEIITNNTPKAYFARHMKKDHREINLVVCGYWKGEC